MRVGGHPSHSSASTLSFRYGNADSSGANQLPIVDSMWAGLFLVESIVPGAIPRPDGYLYLNSAAWENSSFGVVLNKSPHCDQRSRGQSVQFEESFISCLL